MSLAITRHIMSGLHPGYYRQFPQRPVTRSQTNARKSVGWRQMLPAFATIGAAAVNNAVSRSVGTTRSTQTPRRLAYTKSPKIAGRRRKASTSKKQGINRKPLKGISKKFIKKVQKVISHNTIFGKITMCHVQQLRQTTLDRYNYINTDDRGFEFQYGHPNDILSLASMLFNSKPQTDNTYDTTSNLPNDIKIDVEYYRVNMFFKSTSSHVVNIAIYECTSKMPGPPAVLTAINSSYTSLQNNTQFIGGGAAVNTIKEYVTTSQEEWIDLHKDFWVKEHRIKLQPGDYTSKSFTIHKSFTWDGTKYQENNLLIGMAKGNKTFFFRVLNDPTCSTTSNMTPTSGAAAGDVHHWPSNTIGGVALKITRTFKCSPPPSVAESSQTSRILHGEWQNAVSDARDQQVVIMNPITTGNVDNA